MPVTFSLTKNDGSKSLQPVFAETMEGRRENSTLYVIDGYLYNWDGVRTNNMLSVKCTYNKKKCRGRAQLESDTLRVVKAAEVHTCGQWMDPDMRVQIQMENKMKHLAMTTEDSFRKIYDDVSLENPRIAEARIDYQRMECTMRLRRNKAATKV